MGFTMHESKILNNIKMPYEAKKGDSYESYQSLHPK